MNTKPIIRTSLSFGRSPDHKVEETTASVIANLYGNPAFATPPVDEAALTALLGEFQEAMAATAQGGTAATAEKNNKRVLLISKLKELAFYVQITSDSDLATLLSSGFEAVNRNRTSETLPAPLITRLTGEGTGEIFVTVKSVRNARGYEVEYAPVVNDSLGEWQGPIFFTGSRNMQIDGLTPGTVYAFRVRAMGGKTRRSEWSRVSNRMSF